MQNSLYLLCFLQQTTNGHPKGAQATGQRLECFKYEANERIPRSGLGAQATMDSIWIQYGINMDSICNQYGLNMDSIWIQMEDPESEPKSNSLNLGKNPFSPTDSFLGKYNIMND